MEYINERGDYIEPPIEEMLELFSEHYTGMVTAGGSPTDQGLQSADWNADVAREVDAY